MLAHPGFDPVAFSVGPVLVHWYGLMYLVGFAAAWWLGRRRASRPHSIYRPEQVDDLLFYVALGVILGGRLGYALFYDAGRFLDDPTRIFAIWQGGMSFHGGLVGVMAAMALFARGTGRRFFEVADFVAPLVPIGLGLGRIGNFINGNLWGAPSDLPWAMVFPKADAQPRHPSQLYEAVLEGLVLFVVLWIYSRRPRPVMAVSGLFLVGYALARGLVELVRVPDAHIGYLAFGWVTMGHVLSVPMLVGGALMLWLASRSPAPAVPMSEAPRSEAPRSDAPARGAREPDAERPPPATPTSSRRRKRSR